jgi:glycosyltransferase involved in cell wall biosynthesis
VKYFADKGDDVHLVTFDETKEIEGVKIHKLCYFAKPAYPLRVLNVINTARKIDADILHAHYVSHYGVYAALTGLKPFVVSAWGSDVLIEPKRSMIKKCLVKYVLKRADLITGDSNLSMRSIIENLGANRKKVRLIVHGVDLWAFRPVENKENFKKNLSIPESHVVIISTRSLFPIYDVSTFIKAIPYVTDEHPDTCFLIVGDGVLRHQLEELTRKLGVAGNVRFVGSISNEKMPEYLWASDVYVSTSLSDTRSISLLEAMACALPVVATDLEGNRELMKDGINGLIFSKGDSEGLAKKILLLLEDEATRKKFGLANRRIAEETGDYEKEMSKMEKLYKQLIEGYKA